MHSVFLDKVRSFLDSAHNSKLKRLCFRLSGLLLILVVLSLSGILATRYYFTILKPQQQREAIMSRIETLAHSATPISGDIAIFGWKYGSSYKDIEKKDGFVPIEEADIEKGIMAYGEKDRGWLKFALYFNDQGKLMGGKCREYSYAEIANFIVGRWGKGTPLYRYGNYEIYVRENNGRIYLVTKWHEETGSTVSSELSNKASLIMVEKSNAEFLLRYLFDRNLIW